MVQDGHISILFPLVSKADCYVELRLPTATPLTYRTQVIDNSSDPEWNETFQYRIHNGVKVREDSAWFKLGTIFQHVWEVA